MLVIYRKPHGPDQLKENQREAVNEQDFLRFDETYSHQTTHCTKVHCGKRRSLVERRVSRIGDLREDGVAKWKSKIRQTKTCEQQENVVLSITDALPGETNRC